MRHTVRSLARGVRATPLLLLAWSACDRATASDASAKPSAKPDARPSTAGGDASATARGSGPVAVVLEPADLPGIGTLKMPRGYTSTMDKNWRYDLGNHDSIAVSWEPHGAGSLDKAKSMSNILAAAPTVVSATTLPSGHHEIERKRDSDGFTFIAVFGPDWYVKCVAPASRMETCREIVRSKV
jgi:hypothetical protein